MFEYISAFFLNFLIIFASIVLFFAPFVAVFWYRHRHQIKEVGPHFNYFMERFFTSREFNGLVFTWAMLEALIWFVIPEFLLILVIFMKVKKKFDLVLYDVLGTIAGIAIGLIVVVDEAVFLKIPYIYQSMLDQVTVWYNELGVFGLVHQPFSGVPFKAFLHEAQNYDFFWPAFVVIAIFARMIRYLIIYQATKFLYPAFHTFVRKHYAILFVAACLIFTALLMRVVELYK